MAVVGSVMKFFQIESSIVVGGGGLLPIVGYNMGAGKKMRVRKLFTMLLAAEALVGASALILAEGFPRQLIAIFGAANESSYYADFAVKAFRTYLCMMVLACINKACFIFLQAIGKALASTRCPCSARSCSRGLRAAAAGVLRSGRRALFHAGFGCADLCDFGIDHCKNL